MKILKDLYERDDYNAYKLHVCNVEESYMIWMHKYCVEYCDEVRSGKETRIQVLAKQEVSQLIEVIIGKVHEIKEKNTRKWLTTFCEDKALREHFGLNFVADDILVGVIKEMNEFNLACFQRDTLKRCGVCICLVEGS